jgi:hypothetical protein
MYGPAGKVAGGAAGALPVTGLTGGTGILFMVVLGTVLIALGVALTRFIPRRQLLAPTGWESIPRPGGYDESRLRPSLVNPHAVRPGTVPSDVTAPSV